MKIAVLDDYQDVFRALKCYLRLKGHDVALYHDSVKEPAKLVTASNAKTIVSGSGFISFYAGPAF